MMSPPGRSSPRTPPRHLRHPPPRRPLPRHRRPHLDCPKNHLLHVAPLLRDYGFGATFFATRFPDDWRAAHGDTLLSLDELKRLSDTGFETGNHTWSPAGDLDALPDDEAAAENDRLDRYRGAVLAVASS